jgi:hypothetical protein
VRDEVLERAVLDDQLARALFADPRYAFDVVDRIAHQREHVDDLLGRHAEFLAHARRVVPRAFVARVEDADAVAHQLEEILVHGDDGDIKPCGRGLHRQRANHIVGLVAFGVQNRDAERFARGVHHRNLDGELVGHRRAVGLVVRDEVVAERAARKIE